MAYEKIDDTVTLPIASTGIRQYRFVTLSTSGVGYPSASTVGQGVLGVLISSGTTGSTDVGGRYGTVQCGGVAKVEVEASTALIVGALVSASSVGRAQPSTNAGDFIVGRVVSGSSGAANTVISVALESLGSTVAPT
jgi:hypothetical protein